MYLSTSTVLDPNPGICPVAGLERMATGSIAKRLTLSRHISRQKLKYMASFTRTKFTAFEIGLFISVSSLT